MALFSNDGLFARKNWAAQQNYIQSGTGIWSIGTGLQASMTTMTYWINGYSVSSPVITNHSFTASKDTYVYFDTISVTYSEVVNNATSPAAVANAVLVAIVITNGSVVTTINQGDTKATAPTVSSNVLAVSDSIGNLIYPTTPVPGLIGYRQVTANVTTTSTTTTQATGLSCPVIVPANRHVEITYASQSMFTSGLGSTRVQIWDGTVGSGTQLMQYNKTPGVTETNGVTTSAVVMASGNKTYNIGFFNTSAGTATIEAGSTLPTYIAVKLV